MGFNSVFKGLITTYQLLTLYIPGQGWQQFRHFETTDGVSWKCSSEPKPTALRRHSITHKWPATATSSPHCRSNRTGTTRVLPDKRLHPPSVNSNIHNRSTAVLHGTPEHVHSTIYCCSVAMNRTAVACFADVSEFVSLKIEFVISIEDFLCVRILTNRTKCCKVAIRTQQHCVNVSVLLWPVAYRRGVGGLGCSTPPRKSEGPPKSCQTRPDLWKLLKIAEFRTPTHQDVRKKGSKILSWGIPVVYITNDKGKVCQTQHNTNSCVWQTLPLSRQ